MDDDVIDDVEEISLVVNVSYIDWMMKWIDYTLKELYLINYSGSSLYS
jgi:hypothetical protein